MIQEILIVDGYNIIGAWPELQRLKELSLEEARDRLIDIMAEYQSFSGMKVIVVFDAYYVPGLGKKYLRPEAIGLLYQGERDGRRIDRALGYREYRPPQTNLRGDERHDGAKMSFSARGRRGYRPENCW